MYQWVAVKLPIVFYSLYLCTKIQNNMEAGDLIYILLLFFFLIMGLFKKRKPKKQFKAQNQFKRIPTPEEDFDDWFNQKKH